MSRANAKPIYSNELYIGSRNDDFKNMLRSLLEKGNLRPRYIDMLLDDESMITYNNAFTAISASADENYEVFEQLGDITANKFIVWYMYRRFPQLYCTAGVKVVARLRINYGAKNTFWKIAESVGFWNFISSSVAERTSNKKSLLEDAFEAFIGATEYLIDTRIRIGAGYAIVYDILESIFDEIPISLAYEDLYDAKTRLKELCDYLKAKAKERRLRGLEPDKRMELEIKYEDERDEDKHGYNISIVNIIRISGSSRIVIGSGQASIKPDAQQRAATQALEYLKRRGLSKPVPEIYSMFCIS